MIDEDVFVSLGISKKVTNRLRKEIDIEQEYIFECGGISDGEFDDAYLVVTSDGLDICCEECVVDDLERSRNSPPTWVKGVFLLDELSMLKCSEPEQCSCGDDAKYRVDITHLGEPKLSCEDCFIADFKQLRNSPEEITSVELIDSGDGL